MNAAPSAIAMVAMRSVPWMSIGAAPFDRGRTVPRCYGTGERVLRGVLTAGAASRRLTDRRLRRAMNCLSAPRESQTDRSSVASAEHLSALSAPDPSPRNARSSRLCSAISSGSRPSLSPPIPRTSTRCSRTTFRWHGSRSRPTAGRWRSSSAMPSSGSSASPPPTRTIQNVRCARACGSARTPRSWRPRSVNAARAARRDQHRGGTRATRDRRHLGRGLPLGRLGQHRFTDPVGRPGDGRGGRRCDLRGNSSAVFDYDELEPATLKGKSDPVRVFHARNSLCSLRHRRDAHPRDPVYRSRDRPGAPQGRSSTRRGRRAHRNS